MATLKFNTQNLPNSLFPTSHKFNHTLKPSNLNFRRIKAAETSTETTEQTTSLQKGPVNVDFMFVTSVLLPDGNPDMHYRSACGGQKLRDIMLDNNIDLYGPYARPLLNCGGVGTCGTCLVEVVQGKHLLSPRTEKEKEALKRNPKNWRLACQCTVGTTEGMVVIQQLPEWKAHEWTYEKETPNDELPMD